MFQRFAEVALRLPLRRTFTYSIPDSLADLAPGWPVLVDLRGRREEGLVVSLHSNAPDFKTLPIEAMGPNAVLNSEQLALGGWMSEHYLSGLGECLFKMFPSGKNPARARLRVAPAETPRPTLNEQQQAAFDRIRSELGPHERLRPPVHLLHGITGSGKTEVYMRLIQACIEGDQGAVLLVPEIALTVQLISRLREVFGEDLVLLHSALRKSERLRGYLDLLHGKKRIAVGTRSAVFAPVAGPGLFILDEEHDGSYKEHSAPRYHARQVAYHRAAMNGAVLVLGSATPSIETRYMAENAPGFAYHILTDRATGAALPKVDLVRLANPDTPLSGDLLRELEKTIRSGHQALLLLNRRGYQPFQYCAACQASLQCPNCSVTLNLHRTGQLMCHYCGLSRLADGRCDRCSGPVRRLGAGTQKLEEFLLNLYPDWRIERLDTDSASRVGVTEQAVERLLRGDLDILLGTQMIAKGLDAPNVTLVGVLQADLGLNLPDFRAGERTFSLLTQVAGRSGRGEHSGRVIFEVLDVQSPTVLQAAQHDYAAFYAHEIALRRLALYPPFCRLVRLLCRSPTREHAAAGAAQVAAALDEAYRPGDLASRPLLLGPAPAPLERLHGQYRYHVLIKTSRMGDVRAVLSARVDALRAGLPSDTHLEVDFDPTELS